MPFSLRSFILLAAFVAVGGLLPAQSRRVIVEGAASERAPALTSLLERRMPDHPDSIEASVRPWYAGQGFLHALVRRVEPTDEGLRVVLDEGHEAIVSGLTLSGLTDAETEQLRGSMGLQPGSRFSPGILARDIASILSYAERTGRLLATVQVDRLDDIDTPDSCLITIGLMVDVGPALRVAEVRVTGATSTTPATVQRASGIRVGDMWTSRSADDAVKRLLRTRLFTNVSLPGTELNEQQQLVVTLPVTEGKQSSFDGMVGYLPPATGAGRGTVTGLVDIRLGNMLGTARRLAARWFQERQGTQEIGLTYREPWVLGSEIAADLEFQQRKQDSLYVRQQVGVGASGPLDEAISVGASYRRTSTTPIEGYGASVLSSSEQTLLGVQFAYDTRDDAITPRQGMWYATDVQTGRKRSSGVGGSARSAMQRIRIDMSGVMTPFRAQSLVLEAHAVDVRSGTLDVADLVRLGGATDLRGYREGEFLGSRIIWATIEHRLFFSPKSFIGAFVDGGSIRRPDLPTIGISGSDLVRFGYGVTLRVDAPVGLLGISIALGKGDGFSDAKLHVRVQSEF